jgi:hypothetical protein
MATALPSKKWRCGLEATSNLEVSKGRSCRPLAIGETEELLPIPEGAEMVMNSGTFGLGDPVQTTSHWRAEREEVGKFLNHDY